MTSVINSKLGEFSKQTLNEIQDKLRQEKDLGGHVKSDIYSHISEVLNRITKYHPYDALDKFEEISCLVKKINVKQADPKMDS